MGAQYLTPALEGNLDTLQCKLKTEVVPKKVISEGSALSNYKGSNHKME